MIDLDFASVKPSIANFVLVGLLATSFIVAGKFIVNTYRNPATDLFRDFFNAV